MRFFDRLRSARSAPWPPPGPIETWPASSDITVQGSAVTFDSSPHAHVEVVGESHYQKALDAIAGGRSGGAARYAHHTALLLPDPSNQWDANAVRVLAVPSQGGPARLVGYLSREDAVAFRPVIDRVAASGQLTMCHASLKGGWDRDISFGVTLHIGRPWSLMAELDRDLGPDPRWPPQFSALGEDGRPYNRTDCPYCRETMDPLPKAKKRCPSCGRPVYVRLGPDDIRYLLREEDLAAHQARWEASE